MGGAFPRREQPPEPEQIISENWRHDLLQVPFCPLLGPVSGFFLGLLHRLGSPVRAFLTHKTGTAQHFATRPLVFNRPRRNARSENNYIKTLPESTKHLMRWFTLGPVSGGSCKRAARPAVIESLLLDIRLRFRRVPFSSYHFVLWVAQ